MNDPNLEKVIDAIRKYQSQEFLNWEEHDKIDALCIDCVGMERAAELQDLIAQILMYNPNASNETILKVFEILEH